MNSHASSGETGKQSRLGRLYLSTIDEQFDSARDVALNFACLVKDGSVQSDWAKTRFASPLTDDAALAKTAEDLGRLANYLMVEVADDLNGRHGLNRSVDFWRIVAFSWLMELAQGAWIGFSEVREAIDLQEGQPLRVSVLSPDEKWNFADINDFEHHLMHNKRLNWWIRSLILIDLAPEDWVLETLPAPDRENIDEQTSNAWTADTNTGMFSTLAKKTRAFLGCGHIAGIRESALLLAAYANILPRHPGRLDVQPETYESDAEAFPPAFLTVMRKLIAKTMPRSYREDFPVFAREAKTTKYRPGRLRLGTAEVWNDRKRIVLAHALENGEKTIHCQHGGSYATNLIHLHTAEVEYKNGPMFTWGWTEHGDYTGNFVPLPSPLLSKIADRHRFKEDSLIVVGECIRLNLPRLVTQPRQESWVLYLQETLRFVSSLSPAARGATLYRPYLRDNVDFDLNSLRAENFPDIPALTGDLHGKLLRCRLAVLTGAGTTMNIALAANVPTVGFWNPGFHTPSRQAAPLFDALRRHKILFDDPEECAHHINDIWENVPGWWLSPESQEVRQEWTRLFARTSSIWWWHWMRALAALTRERPD